MSFPTMMTTPAVHIATLFAVVIIIVVEIKLGRDYSTWAPILSAIVGYLMPQPSVVARKKKDEQQNASTSMLHIEFADAPIAESTRRDDDAEREVQTVTRLSTANASKWKNVADFAVAVLPSILLLTGTLVWVSTTAPVAAPSFNATTTTTAVECATLRRNMMSRCDKSATPPGVAICSNVSAAELYLEINDGSTLVTMNESVWTALLFRSFAISKEMHGVDCTRKFPISATDYALSCNQQIRLAFPQQNTMVVTLSPSQWIDVMHASTTALKWIMSCPYQLFI